MKSTLAILLALFVVTLIACNDAPEDNATPAQQKTILVTGATGTQGGAVARELLKRGFRVRGLTRNTESDRAKAIADLGATMVQGNFDDAQSLAGAMDGVHGVFAMTDFWEHGYEQEVAHGRRLIDSAIAAGVDHFVFTSVSSANKNTGISHFDSKGEIEVHLQTSGIGYSIVRPVSFMDNVRYQWEQLLAGSMSDPRDFDHKHQWIAASDIGFFVGEAFDKPEEWKGKAVDIAGDEMSLREFAELVSSITGVEVKYEQISWESYEEHAGEEMTAMQRWFDEVGYGVDVKYLRETYPNLLSYKQYLESIDKE